MSGIFNASIFNNAIFNTGEAAQEPTPAEQPAGGGRRKRTRFLVRHNGQETLVDSLDEVQEIIERIKAEAEIQKTKRRNKRRPIAQVEIPGEVQAELYKHDLPDIKPMLKVFDFEGLKAVMDRLEMILKALDEEDIEMLLLH